MKPTHGLLILLIPAAMVALSAVFFVRSERKFEHQMDQVDEVRKLQDGSMGDARSLHERKQDRLLAAARATRVSKSFWVVALGFAGFFLVLAMAFLFYERRHRRQLNRLIASFVSDEEEPAPEQQDLQ